MSQKICVYFISLFLQWFQEGSSPESLKYRAEYAYAKQNFELAFDLYQEILGNKPGGPLYRDACEGFVRCCLRLQKGQIGLEYARQLLQKTNLANIEYASNVYKLLSEVYEHNEKPELAAASIISVIKIHPHFPYLWQNLKKIMESLNWQKEADLCQIRIDELLASFKASMPKSFVRETYYGADNALQITEEEENVEEFVDLGSSKLRAQKEKAWKNANAKESPTWMDEKEALDKYLQEFFKALIINN